MSDRRHAPAEPPGEEPEADDFRSDGAGSSGRPGDRDGEGEGDRWGPATALISRVLAAGLAMVGPGMLGRWLDELWGVNFLALLGFALGLAAGTWYLLLVVKDMSRPRPRRGVGAEDSRK